MKPLFLISVPVLPSRRRTSEATRTLSTTVASNWYSLTTSPATDAVAPVPTPTSARPSRLHRRCRPPPRPLRRPLRRLPPLAGHRFHSRLAYGPPGRALGATRRGQQHRLRRRGFFPGIERRHDLVRLITPQLYPVFGLPPTAPKPFSARAAPTVVGMRKEYVQLRVARPGQGRRLGRVVRAKRSRPREKMSRSKSLRARLCLRFAFTRARRYGSKLPPAREYCPTRR
jgi:hypothetical protein